MLASLAGALLLALTRVTSPSPRSTQPARAASVVSSSRGRGAWPTRDLRDHLRREFLRSDGDLGEVLAAYARGDGGT